MPIPPFTREGLLPGGVHDCSEEEILLRFGSFQSSDRRSKLFAQLASFLVEVRASGLVRWVVVDGSFVTASPEPNDVDLILVVAAEHDLAADLAPFQYNILSRIRVRKRFGFDIVAVREITTEVYDAVSFFQQVRGRPHLSKGVVRLVL